MYISTQMAASDQLAAVAVSRLKAQLCEVHQQNATLASEKGDLLKQITTLQQVRGARSTALNKKLQLRATAANHASRSLWSRNVVCDASQSCNDGMSQLSQAKLSHRHQMTVLTDELQQLKNQVNMAHCTCRKQPKRHRVLIPPPTDASVGVARATVSSMSILPGNMRRFCALVHQLR